MRVTILLQCGAVSALACTFLWVSDVSAAPPAAALAAPAAEHIPAEQLGPAIEQKTGIVSFVISGVHSDQIGQYLNAKGIAIRVGHHCAMPLHERFGIGVSARASFYFYNTESEVDALVQGVEKAASLGRKS